MPVIVSCRCGKRFRAKDELAGTQVPCPGCGRAMVILRPGAGASPLVDELSGGYPGHGAALPAAAGRSRRPAAKLEGWPLALVVLGGSIAALAILGAVVSLLWPGPSRRESGEVASGPAAAPAKTEARLDAEARAAAVEVAEESDAGVGDPSTGAPRPIAADHPGEVAGAGRPGTSLETAAAEEAPAEPRRGPAGADLRQTAEPIRLSAGVALPQTLPTGTAMGFSVDYEFVAGGAESSARYRWVIEPANGQAVAQDVSLGRQGTLQGFVPQLRPENGPFQTHLEDDRGRRLSRSLPLR